MSNPIVAFLIQQVVDLILGSGTLERVAGAVQRWADKEIEGKEKMTGVLNELEVIGLHLAESSARFAIEASIQWLKSKGKTL